MLKLYGRIIEFWLAPEPGPPAGPPCAGRAAGAPAWRLLRAALPPRGELPALILLALLQGLDHPSGSLRTRCLRRVSREGRGRDRGAAPLPVSALAAQGTTSWA